MSAFLVALCLAAPPLARELASFDPVNLPKKEAKALRAEVERRAKSRYGSFAAEHYAELWAEVGTARKRERLAAASARQREALEAEGHTIGIGKGLKFTFLQKLAEEHHGHFTHKEW